MVCLGDWSLELEEHPGVTAERRLWANPDSEDPDLFALARWDGQRAIDYGFGTADVQGRPQTFWEEVFSGHKGVDFDFWIHTRTQSAATLDSASSFTRPADITLGAWQQALQRAWDEQDRALPDPHASAEVARAAWPALLLQLAAPAQQQGSLYKRRLRRLLVAKFKTHVQVGSIHQTIPLTYQTFFA